MSWTRSSARFSRATACCAPREPNRIPPVGRLVLGTAGFVARRCSAKRLRPPRSSPAVPITSPASVRYAVRLSSSRIRHRDLHDDRTSAERPRSTPALRRFLTMSLGPRFMDPSVSRSHQTANVSPVRDASSARMTGKSLVPGRDRDRRGRRQRRQLRRFRDAL